MNETPETLARLQEILDRSAATAGPALRRNFIAGRWPMSAEEFVAFWDTRPMASLSTVSANCAVHAVPLDPRFIDGKFLIATFPDSVRLRDHRANPRCAIAASDGPYRAVIVYGDAREVEQDLTSRTAEVAVEQGYSPADMVSIEVTPTRIYAIRPPSGHPAYREG